MKAEVLRIENGILGKLQHLYMRAFKGEVVGIIFEKVNVQNVFLDLLRGKRTFEYARIYWNEERISVAEARKNFDSGISIISRQSKLINTLSISENIYLANAHVKDIVVDLKKYNNKLSEILTKLDINVHPEKKVRYLSLLERVLLEVLKAYEQRQNIIVLTSVLGMLNNNELLQLWRVIGLLKNEGFVFILLETFEDIELEKLDQIGIVKEGRTVALMNADSFNYHKVYTILYGADVSESEINERKSSPAIGGEKCGAKKATLQFQSLKTANIPEFSMTFQAGEVKKLICVDEDSFSNIVKLLANDEPVITGCIKIGDRSYRNVPGGRWLKKNVGIILENPGESMIFPEMSVLDNLVMSLSRKKAQVWFYKKYLVSMKKMLSNIFDDGIYKTPVEQLEPYQLQQIAYCRWLLYAPKLLVCVRPFSDNDTSVKTSTNKMLELFKVRGIPVLMITSNVAEVAFRGGEEHYLYHGEKIDEVQAYQLVYDKNKA